MPPLCELIAFTYVQLVFRLLIRIYNDLYLIVHSVLLTSHIVSGPPVLQHSMLGQIPSVELQRPRCSALSVRSCFRHPGIV